MMSELDFPLVGFLFGPFASCGLFITKRSLFTAFIY